MMRRISTAGLLLGWVAATGCGGDDADPTPTPDATTDTSVDADAGDGSSAPDAETDVPSEDTDTAGPDADTIDAEVEPRTCNEGEHLVGDRCFGVFDRICDDDGDCRDTESCIFNNPDEFGTCIYNIPDPVVCPGDEGCAPTVGASLRAGFAARVITPQGWELARDEFATNPDVYGTPRNFDGDVRIPRYFCDCGRDLICPPDLVEAGCRTLGTWVAPDADGTEGDNYMSGAWIAGFGNNRNAGLCPDELLSPDCEGFDCCDNIYAHDDIWARGFVVEYGETRVAIVTVDTVGYFYSEIQRIRQSLDPALGIDHLIVSATHVHEAPDTMGRWGPGVGGGGLPGDTGIIPPWMAEIRTAIQEVIAESVSELETVDLYVGDDNTGGPGFGNRDSRDPFIFNDLVTVLQFVPAGSDPREPGNTIGTVVNFHSHPEALGGDNPYITSDFPHYVREAMENGMEAADDEGSGVSFPEYPALGGTSVYLSGTVGGLLTQLSVTVRSRDGRDFREDSFGKAWAQGERLADVAHRILATPCEGEQTKGCYVRAEMPDLAVASQEFTLELENIQFQAAGISLGLFDREVYNWRSDLQTLNGPFPEVVTAVSQVRLGPVTFQTMPGEVFSETVVGYSAEQENDGVMFGRDSDVNCTEDGIDRLDEGVEPRFPCLVRADNPNPPDMRAAPSSDDEYLRGFVPGRYLVAVGLGQDELGYLVPSYDFKWFSGGLIEAEGDHYEESVSVGDELPKIITAVQTINDLLNAISAD